MSEKHSSRREEILKESRKGLSQNPTCLLCGSENLVLRTPEMDVCCLGCGTTIEITDDGPVFHGHMSADEFAEMAEALEDGET